MTMIEDENRATGESLPAPGEYNAEPQIHGKVLPHNEFVISIPLYRGTEKKPSEELQLALPEANRVIEEYVKFLNQTKDKGRHEIKSRKDIFKEQLYDWHKKIGVNTTDDFYKREEKIEGDQKMLKNILETYEPKKTILEKWTSLPDHKMFKDQHYNIQQCKEYVEKVESLGIHRPFGRSGSSCMEGKPHSWKYEEIFNKSANNFEDSSHYEKRCEHCNDSRTSLSLQSL